MARSWRWILAALLGGWLGGCQPAGDSGAQAGQAAPAGSVAKPLTVLVAGATGRTGRRVVAQLRERGHRVRAFVRDEQRARERLGDDLEFAVGDVRETGALAAAFDGVDAVISAIGSGHVVAVTLHSEKGSKQCGVGKGTMVADICAA